MSRKLKKKIEKKYVKICPRCKYANVSAEKSTYIQKTGMIPTMYVCNRCGHSGYIFPEIKTSELKDFEAEAEQKGSRTKSKDKTELVDTAYGKFEVRFLWKITGPLTLFAGILLLFQNTAYQDVAGPLVFAIYGSIVILFGLFMIYITYFKKRKLRDD